MDFFLVMILGVVAQIIGYLIYLKKTRKIINIIFHTPLIILVNIVLFGMLNLISMRDNTFIIPYNWALVLSFWTSFSIVGVLINACFIITLKRANNNTKNSIGNIFLVTLSAVGIIGLILESNRNIAPLVTFCMIVITIVLTAIFAFGYMSYLIKHKKEFSFFIIKHPFSNIESPTRNPTRNILLLIVSFFTLFGAGIAYSLILNRTTSFELGQVARAIGAIISGYIILIFVKKDKNSSHTALLVYVIFVSIITLLMIYFNILVYSAIAVQTTVYHAVIAFLLLYITENNIPKKSPNHSVLIIGTALLGCYSSVAITSCLIYKLKISFDLVMMLSIFTLVCGIVFIIVQKYQRKQFDASEKTNIAINNISDAIINLDQDGIITYTNSAAQERWERPWRNLTA